MLRSGRPLCRCLALSRSPHDAVSQLPRQSSRHWSSSSSSSPPYSDTASSVAGPSSSGPVPHCGQPLPSTHPHHFPDFDAAIPFPALFPKARAPTTYDYHQSLRGQRSKEQLTTGITRSEYETRRRKLMQECGPKAVVIVMGGRMKYMSEKIFYRFRQSSNMFYLTGLLEPDTALVMESAPSTPRGYRMTLFVPFQDENNLIWNGPRIGTDGAVSLFGADEAFHNDDEGKTLLKHLKRVTADAEKVYFDPPNAPTIPRKTRDSFLSSGSSAKSNLFSYLSPPSPTSFDLFSQKSTFESMLKLFASSTWQPLSPIVDKHRLTKSPSELRLMRRSGQIAGLAHNSTMRFSNTGLARSEWDLERHFEYVSGLLGATRMAYVPVVAGGERGCTIHYTDNDHLLDKVGGSSAKKGEGHLVTMDAGVEYAGYTSDITRAWPVSFAPRGENSETVKWTTPQLHLYEALLRVLKECTACCTEDQGYTQRALHTKSVDLLRVELKDLGIDLKAGGDLEKVLYPHYLSHNLGLDLHDVPSPTSRTSLLALGQTLTIEPGLYIPPLGSLQSHRLSSFIPDHFRGIGMRVEDDVAVGSDRNQGPVVLSQEAVKEVQDIIDVCEGRDRKDFASTDQHGSSYLGREVDQILIGKRSL